MPSIVPERISHVAGLTVPPLSEATVHETLAATAAARPDALAAAFPALRWTWAQLASEMDALARGLLSLGIGRGDRVGIWSPNRPEWLLTQFATARIGAILVTVNPAYRTAELRFALRKTGCAAVVLAPGFKRSDYVAMLEEVRADLPGLRHAIVMGEGFEALMAAGRERDDGLDAIRLSNRDPINIQFTSGTTGTPKGATLTHRNIVNNARFVMGAQGLGPGDRLCIPVPFYHCFGMVMGTLGCAATGCAMAIPGEGFDPLATLRTIEAERCTALYAVPTMFVAMLEHPEFASFDLSSLRTGIMAGAPCPTAVMRRVMRDMHMEGVTIAYGMTETAPVSFQSALDTPLERRVGSVGRVQPHVEVALVGEDGAPVPVGAQGEILTRGYSVMAGYWDEPGLTGEAVVDGWMRTGDLGRLDAEGYLSITGRRTDMIIRGGENVYPREIEEALDALLGISQSQVFGVPDARLGEIVCAWVMAAPGARVTQDGVRKALAGRIAHYKVPALVRVVEDWPMTVTGKPQKFLMRRAMMEELGLSEEPTA